MLPVPWPPTPMQPMVILSLAATPPLAPRAEELTMYGNPTAAIETPAAFRRNCRRDRSILVMYRSPFQVSVKS